jgi:release factor glutamine methyltransferase
MKPTVWQCLEWSRVLIQTGEWVRWAANQIEASSEHPVLEAQILLAFVSHATRSQIIAHPERFLSHEENKALEKLLLRLIEGEPLPYITGKQEFYGLSFGVSPAVLIPRPETEMIVENALGWLKNHPSCIYAADVGTGSGCIAISLAIYHPNLNFIAADHSISALQVCQENIRNHQVTQRVWPVQIDLLSAVSRPFSLVCANLPYIPSGRLSSLTVSRWEPVKALDGGPDGFRLIEKLLIDSTRWLAPGALMLLEIDDSQVEYSQQAARSIWPAAQVEVLYDLAHKPRILKLETPLWK